MSFIKVSVWFLYCASGLRISRSVPATTGTGSPSRWTGAMRRYPIITLPRWTITIVSRRAISAIYPVTPYIRETFIYRKKRLLLILQWKPLHKAHAHLITLIFMKTTSNYIKSQNDFSFFFNYEVSKSGKQNECIDTKTKSFHNPFDQK